MRELAFLLNVGRTRCHETVNLGMDRYEILDCELCGTGRLVARAKMPLVSSARVPEVSLAASCLVPIFGTCGSSDAPA